MSRLFAILLAAARATAFVETWRAYDQPQYAFTWQFPLLKNDKAGLGAGLTYAIHPTFCDRIIKSFSERSDIFYAFEFVSCRLLRGAIARAFASWAGNHPHITFIDRSATCDALGLEPAECPEVEIIIDVTTESDATNSTTNEKAERLRQASLGGDEGLVGSEATTFSEKVLKV